MSIFYPYEKHIYTIIILHGMYQTDTSLYKIAELIRSNNSNIKIILPRAPLRTINWPTESEDNVYSWYNYYTRRDGEMQHDIINKHEFTEQTNIIYNIIEKELKTIDPKNIIISGVSQGGTIAFNVGLNFKFKLGGIIGIHTILMDNIIKLNNINNIPLHLFSGKLDEIYDINLQKNSLSKLINKKHKINWHIEKNLYHCQESNKEYEFVFDAINKIIKY
mgnify:CR=1 FL=1|jgi:predicted esterase